MTDFQFDAHTLVIDDPPGVLVDDDREEEPRWFESREAAARYLASRQANPDYLPLGTLAKRVLERFGLKKDCLPCARRQAKLDRLVRRRLR